MWTRLLNFSIESINLTFLQINGSAQPYSFSLKRNYSLGQFTLFTLDFSGLCGSSFMRHRNIFRSMIMFLDIRRSTTDWAIHIGHRHEHKSSLLN